MLFVFTLLALISFSDAIGLNQTEANNTYILELFKSKNITCDPHDFIVKIDDSVNDYQLFLNDLNNVCSESQSDKASRLLCRIVFIELQLACLLPNSSRPTPVKYTLAYTANKICTMNKINLTNVWIWEKLSGAEQQELLPTSDQLCPTITAKEEILFLAKFFYKIAPRIRRADLGNSSKLNSNDSLGNQTQSDDTHVGWMEDQLSTNTTLTNSTADVQGQLQPPVMKSNQTIVLNTTDIGNHTQNQTTFNETTTSPVTELSKSNITANETAKSEGLPLGRVGEKPEREQVNERPKPKVLDVDAVFKLNENEKQNWVEGKKLPNEDDKLNARRINPDDDLLVPSAVARRKFPFRLKSNRQYDQHRDDQNWIDDYFSSVLIFILCMVVVYLVLSNKNKVLGLIIEGCKGRRGTNNQRGPYRHIRLSQSSK